MAKKRKRIYKIMKLESECDQKVRDGVPDVNLVYDTHNWDIACLADYFFMEYYPKSDEELLESPNEEYFRGITCVSVKRHNRVKRVRNENGSFSSIKVTDETYILLKQDFSDELYKEVYQTDNMDELVGTLQLFNDYSSVSWWVDYSNFTEAFSMLVGY